MTERTKNSSAAITPWNILMAFRPFRFNIVQRRKGTKCFLPDKKNGFFVCFFVVKEKKQRISYRENVRATHL